MTSTAAPRALQQVSLDALRSRVMSLPRFKNPKTGAKLTSLLDLTVTELAYVLNLELLDSFEIKLQDTEWAGGNNSFTNLLATTESAPPAHSSSIGGSHEQAP